MLGPIFCTESIFPDSKLLLKIASPITITFEFGSEFRLDFLIGLASLSKLAFYYY